MRLLFLSQVLPYPLDAGPKIRAYYTLRRLAQQHEVVLLSFYRSEDPLEAVDHLRTVCADVHLVAMRRSLGREVWHGARSLLNGQPFLITRDRRAAMLRAVESVVRAEGPFDGVHADQLWMAPYALHARDCAPIEAKPRLVLDQHNAVFQIPSRMARDEPNPLKRRLFAHEASRMARYEVEVCEQFDQVVFVSDEDRAALRNQGRNQHNADRDAVIPISLQPPTSVRRAISTGRNVVFLGGLNWPPNADGVAWFLREVWPLVCAQAPDARFTVVGKIPRSLRLDRNHPSVEFAGYLPSTDTVLDGAAAFVVPLRSGGGMRVKILEAWSRSLPVVSTVVGAEGLAVGPDQNIRLADDPGTFAAHVVALLKDPAAAAALGRGGRQTVDAHYDWRNQYAAWDQVYRCAFSS